jgi:hypothetical protein
VEKGTIFVLERLNKFKPGLAFKAAKSFIDQQSVSAIV